ncbi:ABC-type multidrug transport system, ATPase and permease component [Saprospira grandis DSM 2844]|uniref:ABC-type multidrug transport system, ATPase and permease component n=1 Tax=Saprospira grandis DSM 2844 TaxID=694433 RepID=J1I541_9BACT|nr:ABC transporter ATP-binding protein [Saprospira grandis]EJF53483.1 ABC-type multidrug transport system, ATPase and permease component [Saprospira grandis DSM 2844]
MKAFIAVLAYLKPYRFLGVLNVIFNALTAFFSIFSLMLLGPFLDILFKEEMPSLPAQDPTAGWSEQWVTFFNRELIMYMQEHGRPAALFWVCGIMIGAFFFKNIFRYLALFVMAPVRNGIERDLRQAVFGQLMSLPLSYFSQERKGDLMSRLSSDVKELQWSVLRSVETLVRSPLTLIGSVGVMLYISPELTGFSFGLFLFVGLIIGQLGKVLRKNSAKAQASLGRILSQIEESIGGLRVIQAFGAEGFQRERFAEENSYYLNVSNRIQWRKDLSSPLTEFLGICVIAALLLYGGHLVFDGAFDASTFVMFILMFYNIIDPAKSFATALYDVQKGRAAADRLNQILKAPREIDEQPNALPISELKEAIEVKNIQFGYEKDQKVLDGVSFRLEKGKTIALVGVSGSGKSTIADLLPRFYEPQAGEILLDGEPLSAYRLQDLRALFGMVSQDAILFNDTIYNNIVFGLPDVTKEQVEAAAKIAFAHDFIMEQEEGYQTNIGDRGMKLSGGQRQRLTIARAVLRNPQVLILDEASSALDAESEQAVQKALDELMQERTALLIAHRLSTVQKADEILVMQEGKIVERGSPAALVAQNGVYAKLVALQRL